MQWLAPLLDVSFSAEQERIVVLLVERVDIGIDGPNVRLSVNGLRSLARKLLADDDGAAACPGRCRPLRR